MLAPAAYPPLSKIFASVALTFFAYLGFGVISFVGGDIENPKENMPRAMYISLGFTMVSVRCLVNRCLWHADR